FIFTNCEVGITPLAVNCAFSVALYPLKSADRLDVLGPGGGDKVVLSNVTSSGRSSMTYCDRSSGFSTRTACDFRLVSCQLSFTVKSVPPSGSGLGMLPTAPQPTRPGLVPSGSNSGGRGMRNRW